MAGRSGSFPLRTTSGSPRHCKEPVHHSKTRYHSPVDRILAHVQARQGDTIALIRRMAECESPTVDTRAADRLLDLVGAEAGSFATVQTFPGGKFGRHLLCEFALP